MIQKDFSPDSGKIIQKDGSIFYLSDLYNNLYNAINNSYCGVKVVDIERCLINNGLMFQISTYFPLLAFEGKIILGYKCPVGRKTHIKNLKISTSGATLKVTMYTGITFLTGTPVTENVRNLNENYNDYNDISNYTHGELYSDLTFEGGKEWKNIVIHGSTTVMSVGSGDFADLSDYELITKNDGSYSCLVIENIDPDENTANDISLYYSFYDTIF